MRQLYVPNLVPPGQVLALEGDERHYLGRSLRARPGERFRLAAPDGSAAVAVLEAFEGPAALLRVDGPDPDPDWGLGLALDLCPPRGAALDAALEMAVQLGVARLRLVRSERTLAAPGQGALKPARVERLLREACRQCLRALPPPLEPPVSLAEALRSAPEPRRLVLSERGGGPLPALAPGGTARVLAGPEGGFTSAEFGLVADAGWEAVSLGPRPLKTPTAVAAALAGLRALGPAPGEGR